MNESIRVGIAGLGRSGWDIHAKLLEPLAGEFQVVAVVDADDGRRQEAIDRFDCQAYTDYEQLLADPAVELVVVSLPSFLHANGAIAALDAGKHVVCEKPMATSLADADRMVVAAERTGKVLTIFQQRRYNPDFVKVREVIDSGLLGRIVQIRTTESRFSRRWDWQTLQKFGGGSLNNTGPHFLDMVLQLFGENYPDEVFCQLDRTLTLGDADDHLKLVIKGKDAPTIDVEISSCCAFPGETWNVMGTQGGLAGSTRQLRWKWVDWAEQAPRTLDLKPTPDRSYNRDELVWHEASWDIANDTTPGHAQFYHDLFATIRNGAPLVITPQSVRRVIWLQEECHRLCPLTQEIF
ncbi:MAG TPA: Gfo/Idh/MocA family oxidoreductase [Caldilineaceae bacterium]|nr:Gfo/Idh/MocA family oxidoreductase [Caldilineaceae bacterium]